jgi:hypothetical protein
MKYIEHPSSSEVLTEKLELMFNKNGKQVSSEDTATIYAKHIKLKFLDGSVQQKFLALCKRYELYDPSGMDSHREKNLELELREVNQSVFDMYLMYLNTKNSLYFTKANRSLING